MLAQQREDIRSGLEHDEALCRVRNLLPLRHLGDPEFATIASATSVEHCAAGGELFRAGQDDSFFFYLLSGEVSVNDAKDHAFVVAADGVESRYPLTPHAEARVRAQANTPVQFLRFPASLMRLHREEVREDVSVEEITEEDDAFDNRVLFEVYHAVMNDELVLPSLPDVAIRIREAANNPNSSVEDIARIIQADASTAAYCISIANNAAHAGSAQIDNVLDAVVRMGIQSTRDVVVSYTIRSLFAGKDPQSKKLMREAWKHSCRIAALSFILARDVARLNPERALLAGLLHDIGVTVLITEAQAHPELMADPNAFNQLSADLAGQIGAMILRAWKFPDVFAEAALEAEFFAKPVAERLQLCDVVMLAHLHDQQPAPWSLPTPNLADLAIHRKLGAYDMTDDCRLAVIEQADQELAELTQLLSN